MPIDIHQLRENPEVFRESQKKRFRDPGLVDLILEKDREWVKELFSLEQMKKEKNKAQNIIKSTRDKEERRKYINANKQLKGLIAESEEQVKVLRQTLDFLLRSIGNLIEDGVPISDSEDNNKVVRTWGECSVELENHHHILKRIGGYDQERGAKVAGHRGYFLTGVGCKLKRALTNYAIDFLEKEGYTSIETPFMMQKDVMGKVAQLEDYDDTLYQVNDKYLIATSEQPLCGFHMNETLPKPSLPLRYAGFSSCFRKEAGGHGRDTWGVFRVHQFEKIEQFCITKPEESAAMHEKMVEISCKFLESLNIPYRVVMIVSKELNNATTKKYDIEAWFPGYQQYKELVSASNCTDYQSRAMNIKFSDQGEQKFVHMLNGTLCAVQRTLCCILENYQKEKGVEVPNALRSYVKMDFIPYKEPKIDNNKFETFI